MSALVMVGTGIKVAHCMGNTKRALWISATGVVISMIFTTLRLPIAYVCARYMGLNGIWWSITISTIIKGSVLVGIYCIKIRKQFIEVAASMK